MKMTYTKSEYEMPDGKYLAKFTGAVNREEKPGEKPRLGQDGNPMPPAMTWNFEIVEGEQKGKRTDKLTGRIPTPKSGCGKMLAAIADAVLKDGYEVDLAAYVGKLYRITVIDNRVSDNPAPVRVHDAPTPTAPPNPTAPRPPAPPASTVPEPAAESKWETYNLDGKWEPMTAAQVREFIVRNTFSPDSVYVKPAGADQAAAKPAAQYGFTADSVPF